MNLPLTFPSHGGAYFEDEHVQQLVLEGEQLDHEEENVARDAEEDAILRQAELGHAYHTPQHQETSASPIIDSDEEVEVEEALVWPPPLRDEREPDPIPIERTQSRLVRISRRNFRVDGKIFIYVNIHLQPSECPTDPQYGVLDMVTFIGNLARRIPTNGLNWKMLDEKYAKHIMTEVDKKYDFRHEPPLDTALDTEVDPRSLPQVPIEHMEDYIIKLKAHKAWMNQRLDVIRQIVTLQWSVVRRVYCGRDSDFDRELFFKAYVHWRSPGYGGAKTGDPLLLSEYLAGDQEIPTSSKVERRVRAIRKVRDSEELSQKSEEEKRKAVAAEIKRIYPSKGRHHMKGYGGGVTQHQLRSLSSCSTSPTIASYIRAEVDRRVEEICRSQEVQNAQIGLSSAQWETLLQVLSGSGITFPTSSHQAEA